MSSQIIDANKFEQLNCLFNFTDSLNQPLGGSTPGIVPEKASYPAEDRDTYHYQNDPSLYEINDTDHQSLKFYEERLIAKKTHQSR